MASPLEPKFFGGSIFQDKNITTRLRSSTSTNCTIGWIISSPVTTTFSKMNLDTLQVSYAQEQTSARNFDRMADTYQQPPRELPRRLSVGSDASTPGLSDDNMSSSFNSSSSHTSLEGPQKINIRSPDLTSDQIWDLFFQDESQVTIPATPIHHLESPHLGYPEPSLKPVPLLPYALYRAPNPSTITITSRPRIPRKPVRRPATTRKPYKTRRRSVLTTSLRAPTPPPKTETPQRSPMSPTSPAIYRPFPPQRTQTSPRSPRSPISPLLCHPFPTPQKSPRSPPPSTLYHSFPTPPRTPLSAYHPNKSLPKCPQYTPETPSKQQSSRIANPNSDLQTAFRLRPAPHPHTLLRSRAYTLPIHPIPNRSTSTPIRAPKYPTSLCSAPNSPRPEPEAQKSFFYFDDDDEEGEGEKKWGLGALSSKLGGNARAQGHGHGRGVSEGGSSGGGSLGRKFKGFFKKRQSKDASTGL